MNIYVGSLHFKMNEAELRELFEEYGEVTSAKIIIDKYSGKSKGFGFVEMPNGAEAKKAIEELNGAEVSGRNIIVNESIERSDSNRRNFRGGDSDRRGGGNRRKITVEKNQITMKGTVKWYDRVKGYGFLQTDTIRDNFVHVRAGGITH